jgi:hypothetical protein
LIERIRSGLVDFIIRGNIKYFHGNSNEKGKETFATAFCLTNGYENDEFTVQETLKGVSAPKVTSILSWSTLK